MENVYQAPQSEIVPDEPTGGKQSFYLVSQKKFWILFLVTMGGYQLYWFYKHWKIYQERTGAKLWPVARAFFSIFFVHRLFENFQSAARMQGRGKGLGPELSGLATFYIIVTIGDRLASRFLVNEDSQLWVDLLYWIPLPLIGFFLSKAQRVANLASGDELGEGNRKLSAANWFWIAVGVLYWGYIVYTYLVYYGVVA